MQILIFYTICWLYKKHLNSLYLRVYFQFMSMWSNNQESPSATSNHNLLPLIWVSEAGFSLGCGFQADWRLGLSAFRNELLSVSYFKYIYVIQMVNNKNHLLSYILILVFQCKAEKQLASYTECSKFKQAYISNALWNIDTLERVPCWQILPGKVFWKYFGTMLVAH